VFAQVPCGTRKSFKAPQGEPSARRAHLTAVAPPEWLTCY
jgi:hypothetical protein